MNIDKLLKNLKIRKMNGYYFEKREEIVCFLREFIEAGSKVGCGNSETLNELGIYDFLRRGNFEFLDKYLVGLSREEKRKIYLENFNTDYFFTSCNAITADGEIFFIDGNGSRVAPIIYGPKKVVIITGINKIVDTEKQAVNRARQIAAPLDAIRLNKKSPCVKLGKCIDCKSGDRICNSFVKISSQFDNKRIHVLIVNESLGF